MTSLAAVAVFLSAIAQPDGTTARNEFDRGMHHYSLGEFARALEHFKASYAAAPHPELLFDMGQCHRNLGQNDRAIFFFERYVHDLPHGAEAEEVHALLAELRVRPTVVYEPPPLTATVSRDYDLTLPIAPPVEEPALTERWWFWAAMFGAAAVAAGGVVLAVAITEPDRGIEKSIPVFDVDP